MKKGESIKKVHLNLIKSILIIGAEDSLNLERREKIYHRLFMQDFYIQEICISLNNRKVSKISKSINIPGFLEFMLRVTFPAFLFEELYNSGFINLNDFPINKLKEFSKSDAYSSLIELYDEFIPFWGDSYTNIESKKLRFEIPESITRPYRKDLLNFSAKDNLLTGTKEFYWHPFKEFAYYSQIAQDFDKKIDVNTIYKFMPKGYLNQHKGALSNLLTHIQQFKESTKNVLNITDSGFGIISSLTYTSLAANNILATINRRDLEYECFKSILIESYKTISKNTIENLFRIEMEKSMASLEAILLNSLIISFLDQRNYKYIHPKKYDKKYQTHRFDIHKDLIYSGTNNKNTLLKWFSFSVPFYKCI